MLTQRINQLDHPGNGVIDAVGLRAYCEQTGIWISADGWVRLADAAKLIGLSPKTLRNRRSECDPSLPAFKKRRGRVLCSIDSIAAWLAEA